VKTVVNLEDGSNLAKYVTIDSPCLDRRKGPLVGPLFQTGCGGENLFNGSKEESIKKFVVQIAITTHSFSEFSFR
jgi:hypothetical protein